MNYRLAEKDGEIYISSNNNEFKLRKSPNINLYMPDYKEFKGKPEQHQKYIIVNESDLRKIYNDIKTGVFEGIDKYGKRKKMRN